MQTKSRLQMVLLNLQRKPTKFCALILADSTEDWRLLEQRMKASYKVGRRKTRGPWSPGGAIVMGFEVWMVVG